MPVKNLTGSCRCLNNIVATMKITFHNLKMFLNISKVSIFSLCAFLHSGIKNSLHNDISSHMIIINSFQYRYNWIPATASSGTIIKSWLFSWTCFQGIPLNSGRGYDVFHVFLIFTVQTFWCTFILRLLRAFLNFIVHSSLKQTTLHSRTWCLSRANRARSIICWSGVCRVFSRDWISLSWSEWWLCKTTSYGNPYSTYSPSENKF